jgi:hypothetical protein
MDKQHWLLRIGDGDNFKKSSRKSIWGIDSTSRSGSKSFLKNVKEGDILWFVPSKTPSGPEPLVAMATYTTAIKRITGPLIKHSLTNEELGWTEGNWDMEIHYKNLKNISTCGLYPCIKAALVIRQYPCKCNVNLFEEYINIMKYSHVTNTFD